MFGEANTDWGGAESIDSGVEMAVVEPDTPRAAPSSLPLDPTDFQVVPATHLPRASQREGVVSPVDREKGATPTPATTIPLSHLHKLSSRICSHLGKKRVSR